MKKTIAPTIATCLTGITLTMLAACNATMPPAASTEKVVGTTANATEAATKTPAATKAIVSFNSATTTAQGGVVDPFSYSEKPGDATLGNVSVANGVARVTGKLGAEKGSAWSGVGLRAGTAAGGKTIDMAGKGNLHIKLASATASTLRVRIMGADKTTSDNGCYPVSVQKVSAELRDYTIPLSSFAPEAYCAAMGRSIGATAGAVAAIEVSDPSSPSKTRNVDFSVGSVELQP